MIGMNILNLRKLHHLSQEELAGKIGVSRQTIAKWESGESIPDIVNSNALAQVFEVTLDDLVNYSSEEPASLPIPPKGKYMFGMVTVGERGQIVIPAKARKVFDIKPGDNLIVLGDINQGLALVSSDIMVEMMDMMNGGRK